MVCGDKAPWLIALNLCVDSVAWAGIPHIYGFRGAYCRHDCCLATASGTTQGGVLPTRVCDTYMACCTALKGVCLCTRCHTSARYIQRCTAA